MLQSIYSTTYLAELEPYFQVEVNGAALSYVMRKQVEYIVLEEEENKKGRIELVVNDPESTHLEAPFFKLGGSLIFNGGYVTAFEERGPFEIVNVAVEFKEVGLTIKVKGEEGGRLARRSDRRVFTTGTLRDLFVRIARDNGMEFSGDDDDPFLDQPVDEENPVVQTGESDGAFLQRIANDYGWALMTANGKVHLTPPFFRKVLGKIKLVYNSADASIVKVTLKQGRSRPSYVNKPPVAVKSNIVPPAGAIGQSADGAFLLPDGTAVLPMSQEPMEVNASVEGSFSEAAPLDDSGSVRAGTPSVGAESRVFIADDGTVTVRDYGGMSALPEYGAGLFDATTANTSEPHGDTETGKQEERAKRRGAMIEGKLESIDVVLKLGSMLFRPQMELVTSGLGGKNDGSFRVVKVTQRFDNRRFSTQLTAAVGAPSSGRAKGSSLSSSTVAATPEEEALGMSIAGGMTEEGTGQMSVPAPEDASSGMFSGFVERAGQSMKGRTFIGDDGKVTVL